MKVFYRIYPDKPDNRPFADGDKRQLVRTCLNSFLESCRGAGHAIHLSFLLDGCPDDWASMAHYAAWGFERDIIILDGIGNKPSFLKQLDMALEGPGDEFVYFAEDDYLYRPMAVREMLAVSQYGSGLLTPYDHPDRYSRGDDRRFRDYIEVFERWHWRTIESTTMTFGGPRWIFQVHEDIMRKYACGGRMMWYPMWDKGQLLWSPIPSLATHVHDGVLAPCVDWEEEWRRVSVG